MTCYAPGPWRRTGRVIESVDHAKWYTVAWVADDAFTPEAIAANAALIAAAPELHQALAEVLGDYRNDLAVIRPRTLKRYEHLAADDVLELAEKALGNVGKKNTA